MERTILPNAAPFPTLLTDEVMPLVSGDEWKVIHYGVVACLRQDRTDECVSVAQFAAGTGLPEDRVRQCLSFLCDTAQIFLRHDRPRKPQAYKLNAEIGAAQIELLESRHHGRPLGAPAGVQAPAASPARPAEKPPGPFPEHPSVDIRLDGSATPVGKHLSQTLPEAERAGFEHLLGRYPRGKDQANDGEVWGLFRLWQTYGFTAVDGALAHVAASTDLSELNRVCLQQAVTTLYQQEIGLETPRVASELERLCGEYPILSEWQEAFRTAARINKRRLSTLETILTNQRQAEIDADQRPVTRPRPVSPAAGAARRKARDSRG